jgi:hypothetical protein
MQRSTVLVLTLAVTWRSYVSALPNIGHSDTIHLEAAPETTILPYSNELKPRQVAGLCGYFNGDISNLTTLATMDPSSG